MTETMYLYLFSDSVAEMIAERVENLFEMIDDNAEGKSLAIKVPNGFKVGLKDDESIPEGVTALNRQKMKNGRGLISVRAFLEAMHHPILQKAEEDAFQRGYQLHFDYRYEMPEMQGVPKLMRAACAANMNPLMMDNFMGQMEVQDLEILISPFEQVQLVLEELQRRSSKLLHMMPPQQAPAGE